MSDPRLADPGLQPERTRLAWRRTALTLAAGSLAALRLLPERLGDWAIAVGPVGLAAAVTLWLLAGRRATRAGAVILHGTGELPDGRFLAAVAALVAVAAAFGLALLLG